MAAWFVAIANWWLSRWNKRLRLASWLRGLTRLRRLRPGLPWYLPAATDVAAVTDVVCVDGVRWVHSSDNYVSGEGLRPECAKHLTPVRYRVANSGEVRGVEWYDELTDDPPTPGAMHGGWLYCEGTGGDDQHPILNREATTYGEFHDRARAVLQGARERPRQEG